MIVSRSDCAFVWNESREFVAGAGRFPNDPAFKVNPWKCLAVGKAVVVTGQLLDVLVKPISLSYALIAGALDIALLAALFFLVRRVNPTYLVKALWLSLVYDVIQIAVWWSLTRSRADGARIVCMTAMAIMQIAVMSLANQDRNQPEEHPELLNETA